MGKGLRGGALAELTKAGLASCGFRLETPPGSQGSLSKVNNLPTLSFSLVSQPKPSNRGVHEKSVHRESEPSC